MAKKSWAEKMLHPAAPEVVVLDKDMLGFKAGQRLVIVTPQVVAEKVRAIPAGETREVKGVREELAREYEADGCCPLTFGIFLRIVSEAAWDELEAGASTDAVVPFWRAVDLKSPLAKKLRCDREWLEGMVGREVVFLLSGESSYGFTSS